MVATVNITTSDAGNIVYFLEDGTTGQCASFRPPLPSSAHTDPLPFTDNLGDLAWVRRPPSQRTNVETRSDLFLPLFSPSTVGNDRDRYRRDVRTGTRVALCVPLFFRSREEEKTDPFVFVGQTRVFCEGRTVRFLPLLLFFSPTEEHLAAALSMLFLTFAVFSIGHLQWLMFGTSTFFCRKTLELRLTRTSRSAVALYRLLACLRTFSVLHRGKRQTTTDPFLPLRSRPLPSLPPSSDSPTPVDLSSVTSSTAVTTSTLSPLLPSPTSRSSSTRFTKPNSAPSPSSSLSLVPLSGVGSCRCWCSCSAGRLWFIARTFFSFFSSRRRRIYADEALRQRSVAYWTWNVNGWLYTLGELDVRLFPPHLDSILLDFSVLPIDCVQD
jgi:hypothetical protein